MTNSEIRDSIEKLMDEHYSNHDSFESFSEQILALGIVRLSFDALTNETHFYTESKLVFSLKMKNLIEAQAKDPWKLGASFNTQKVQQAIQDYDAQKIDAIQFHHDIFTAGVVFGTVFLKGRKIFYQGGDGQFFLEDY